MYWSRQSTRRRRRPGITCKITRDWELQKAGKRRKEATTTWNNVMKKMDE
jgi:hypothetical protein